MDVPLIENFLVAMIAIVNPYRQIVIPMAVPILAGPGSITTVILFGSGSQN